MTLEQTISAIRPLDEKSMTAALTGAEAAAVTGRGAGLSTAGLERKIAVIEAALASNDELILRVQETIAESLGESLPTAMSARFDDRLALASLRFYDLAKVPAIRDGVPPDVSDVHFRSDLSHTTALAESEVQDLSAKALLFLPRLWPTSPK